MEQFVSFLILENLIKQSEKPLIQTAKFDKDCLIKHFHRADKNYSLICRKHKIVIPKLLEKQVVEY